MRTGCSQMDICTESHLFGHEIFPIFRKSPFLFFQILCLHFMAPTFSHFLLLFPPLRKTEREKQHEEEILPRFKITVHSERHLFSEGQLFSNCFPTERTGISAEG